MDAMAPLNQLSVTEWFERGPLFSIAFQSLVSLSSGHVVGYEILSRPTTQRGASMPVEEFFELVTQLGKAVDMDRLIVERAMHLAHDYHINVPIFINLHPDSLSDPTIQQRLIPTTDGNIVIEITERGNWNGETMEPLVHHYQNLGGSIALDDFGSGYSGLQKLVTVRPNYVKIDRGLIDGCDRSAVKRNLIASIEQIAKFLGFSLIAEGIETYDEMVTCMNLGVDIGQGFYFSRPSSWERHPFPDPALRRNVAELRTQMALPETAQGDYYDPFRSHFALLMEHLSSDALTKRDQLNLVMTTLDKVLHPYSLTCFMVTPAGLLPVASRGHAVRTLVPLEIPSVVRQCYISQTPQVVQRFCDLPATLAGPLHGNLAQPQSVAVMPLGRPTWGLLEGDFLSPSSWSASRLQILQGMAELLTLLIPDGSWLTT
ncbi:MAG: EAL domain-containing protein [Sulfobacillus sp.]